MAGVRSGHAACGVHGFADRGGVADVVAERSVRPGHAAGVRVPCGQHEVDESLSGEKACGCGEQWWAVSGECGGDGSDAGAGRSHREEVARGGREGCGAGGEPVGADAEYAADEGHDDAHGCGHHGWDLGS